MRVLVTLIIYITSVMSQENCTLSEDFKVGNWTYPGGQVNSLTNITWGQDEYKEMLPCVDKFVLLYSWDGNDSEAVLCPSFNISQMNDEKFGCQANFTTQTCNQTVQLSIEAWTNQSVMLPTVYGRVFVNCDLNLSQESIYTEVFFGILDEIAPVLNTNCSWSTWSSWSACSVSCGDRPGTQTRTKNQNCTEAQDTEARICLVNKCPRHCQWSLWSSWSTCSTSCGTGQRSRSRQISAESAYGGTACQDQDQNESEPCAGHTCPVNGQWGQWSRWSYCNATCGQGVKSRTRLCDSPQPENGGFECQGQDREETKCEALRVCQAIDGGWSAWSRWSGCSSSCGKGQIIRSRTCSNPQPQHGGQPCPGEPFQKRPCYLKKCRLETDEGCPTLPYVKGMFGPTKTNGDRAKYSCYHGQVLDRLTNQRDFYLPCSMNTFEKQSWPQCIQPAFCLGPAKRNLKGLSQPFPIRDIPINTELKYHCQMSNKTLSASCCLDGIYRYPDPFDCESNPDNTSCHRTFDIVEKGDFGWIEGDNCSATFNIANGLFVKVGIENGATSVLKVNGFEKTGGILQLTKATSTLEFEGNSRLHFIAFEA